MMAGDSSLLGAEGVMAARVSELAAHLFDLHGRLPSEARIEARLLVDARKVPCCPECEAWLRQQLEALGKEGG